jgi:hypothetical protein
LASAKSRTLALASGEQKRQNPQREELGHHRRQSQQSRLELGLRFSRGFSGTNDLDYGRAPRRKRFVVRADQKLTAFLELEAAIRVCGDCA